VAVAFFLPGRAKDLTVPPRLCVFLYVCVSVCVCVCVCVCVFVSLQTTNISFNRNWCVNFEDGADRGLLNYAFILYTPFNYEPNNATYLRQVPVLALSLLQLGFRE